MNYKIITATIAAIMLFVSTAAMAQIQFTTGGNITAIAETYVKVFDQNGDIRKNKDITGIELAVAGKFLGLVSFGVDTLLAEEEISLSIPEKESLGAIAYKAAQNIIAAKDKIGKDDNGRIALMVAIGTAYNIKKTEIDPAKKKFSY